MAKRTKIANSIYEAEPILGKASSIIVKVMRIEGLTDIQRESLLNSFWHISAQRNYWANITYLECAKLSERGKQLLIEAGFPELVKHNPQYRKTEIETANETAKLSPEEVESMRDMSVALNIIDSYHKLQEKSWLSENEGPGDKENE